MAKTNGHPVESKLEEVAIGDAAGAWETVLKYFIQTTLRGRKTATDNFWFSTMKSTDTDLLQGQPFAAETRRCSS